MAHGRREDPRDDSYNGETYPRSTDAPQYHLSENEQVQGQTQSTVPPASQYLGYAPWSASTSHPGFQEPRYACCAVPCSNDGAPGTGAWHEARQVFPPVPAMIAAPQYTNTGAGSAGGAIPHQWENRNSSATRVHPPHLSSSSQPHWMAGQGPTSLASVPAGASTNMQSHAPGIDAPVLSESLRALARRLILDLGTHVNALNVEESGSGRLRVTITLETADIV
ncbi:hypothetical protein EI94DRAFT_1740343 [Lactarius quietus]|nr:hypothetical protein EI94DRAFT_1740343 [Lactarius quietus]